MDLNGRRLPVGAEVMRGKGVDFRLWADQHKKVELVLEGGPGAQQKTSLTIEMASEGGGYFSALVPDAADGTLYRVRLDGNKKVYPDPASRFQPEGPYGPSRVVDPERFTWTDKEWKGLSLKGQVIYEMHVGTFTKEGTFRSAASELHELASAGLTLIELMPVADFVGQYGWGYDGVDLFAPTRLYGEPDDFRYFVDAAHAAGLGVILDVVYNHVGIEGNYLPEFSASYFSHGKESEWGGNALNFDGQNCGAVREFYIANAGYWIEEFHLDGLRIDSAENIHDSSSPHILVSIEKRVRSAAKNRGTIIIVENESQNARFIRSQKQDGYGLDAAWNEDFHHAAIVRLTGRNEAYYTDYRGLPQEFISALKWGYLYQGQYYSWQKKARGTPTIDLPPASFVLYIQNHDQVANSARGDRADRNTTPGLYRAMTALLLLAPCTPMLFQGQEFAASTPFYYFADLSPELAEKVHEGRLEHLSQFPSLADEAIRERIANVSSRDTFEESKLDFSERERHKEVYALHKDLLKLRREDPVFSAQKPRSLEGAVLSDEAFLLRFFGEKGDDRLMTINFGLDLDVNPAPEPLLAPPPGMQWELLWNSENVAYGGLGTPIFELERNWRIPGKTAIVLLPKPVEASGEERKSHVRKRAQRKARSSAKQRGKERAG